MFENVVMVLCIDDLIYECAYYWGVIYKYMNIGCIDEYMYN
jgi:hypothetical protein